MTTYEEVAKQQGLDDETTLRYLWYMRARWPGEEATHCQVGYAREWAARFHAGIEFAASDSYGQALLRGLP
jgi:hypothetical protein